MSGLEKGEGIVDDCADGWIALGWVVDGWCGGVIDVDGLGSWVFIWTI